MPDYSLRASRRFSCTWPVGEAVLRTKLSVHLEETETDVVGMRVYESTSQAVGGPHVDSSVQIDIDMTLLRPALILDPNTVIR